MRLSISVTPISVVPPAVQSRMFPSSTGRTPEQREAGHGIAIALIAAGLPAETMGRRLKMLAMLGSKIGEGRIPPLPLGSISVSASSKSMASRQSKSRKCGPHRADVAPSASARHRVSSWITATRKVTSARCFARPVTPSWVGMKRRRTRSLSSSDMWKRIAADQPCHADVLLELANA